jgi:CDGSH-type Zn-finger protein
MNQPDVTITAYPNGPFLVRGDYKILDPNGDEIEQTRRTVALCRCGKSRRSPWCDGTHKNLGLPDL